MARLYETRFIAHGLTVSVTSVPSNESELQLYRVLQRANLLNYYDVMIELGGDDVQQLCDAGEEEFLEIMALVGMASKPLHVRRLQKSLQEWMTQPHLFQIPLINASHFPQLMPGLGTAATPLREGGTEASNSIAPSATSNIPIRPIAYHSSTGAPTMAGLPPGFVNPMDIMKNLQSKLSSLRNPSPAVGSAMKSESHGSNSNSPLGHLLAQAAIINGGAGQSLMPSAHNGIGRIPVNGMRGGHSPTGSIDQHPAVIHDQRMLYASRHRSEDGSSPSRSADSPQLDSRTSLSPVPFLQDGEVERLAEAAANLAANLLPSAIEPRLSAKKKVCVEYETIIRIPENDPGRLDVVRKFAAIYGRQDCKRKVQKPLTLHELTVNEAAAQLCSRLPALLTRRDELFPLARQVVKDAGLPYGAGIASIISSNVSMAKGGRHGEDVMKMLSHHNNNNIPGLMANGYGKRAKFDARGAEDLRSPYSHDGESNSEDSHLTNDSFSSQNRSMSSSRQVSEDLTNENMGHLHSATNGALDMSSTAGGTSADEPNDLTISKAASTASSKSYPNNSGRRSSSPHLLSTRSNIKSEPVS